MHSSTSALTLWCKHAVAACDDQPGGEADRRGSGRDDPGGRCGRRWPGADFRASGFWIWDNTLHLVPAMHVHRMKSRVYPTRRCCRVKGVFQCRPHTLCALCNRSTTQSSARCASHELGVADTLAARLCCNGASVPRHHSSTNRLCSWVADDDGKVGAAVRSWLPRFMNQGVQGAHLWWHRVQQAARVP